MKILSLAALALGLTAAGSGMAAVVTNGNFETGTLSGWTVSGNVAVKSLPFYGFTDPAYGGYIAVFNSGDSTPNGILSQTIATIVGQTYSLTFNYGDNAAQGGQNGQQLTASLVDGTAGSTIATQTIFSNSTAVQLATISFTALSASTTIKFADVASNNTVSQDFAIDNVNVSSVPEPASWAMMIGGFGLIGAALRRNRKATIRFA